MSGFERTRNDCKHDHGFSVWIGHEQYPQVWRCMLSCGYFLCFDPAKFPDGVSYRNEPLADKVGPRMSTYRS